MALTAQQLQDQQALQSAYANWQNANPGKSQSWYGLSEEKQYLPKGYKIGNDLATAYGQGIDIYGNTVASLSDEQRGMNAALGVPPSMSFDELDKLMRSGGMMSSYSRNASGNVTQLNPATAQPYTTAPQTQTALASPATGVSTITPTMTPAAATATSANPTQWTTPNSTPQMFSSVDDIFSRSIGSGKSNLGGLLGNTSPYNNPFSGKK